MVADGAVTSLGRPLACLRSTGIVFRLANDPQILVSTGFADRHVNYK